MLIACVAFAQSPATAGTPGMEAPPSQMLVVLPFENLSNAPGLDWIGEAFPEILNQRLESSALYIVRRADRLYAFDRLGLPSNVQLSHATLLRVAQEMDVDYVVFGTFNYDGQTFSATARLLDMARLHMYPQVKESGSLLQLMQVENVLAWDLLRQLDPTLAISRNDFVAQSPVVRLDAFEAYIRGTVAATKEEKIQHFLDALKLNPDYTMAQLHLGETYYEAHEYADSAEWLAKVPKDNELAREANFYLGLASFYEGNYQQAEDAFQFVASRLPLSEVYNNLGVVADRRAEKSAISYFQHAVDADPNDPDYHFNLAVAMYRSGDKTNAAAQLKSVMSLNPDDAEARALLAQVGGQNGVTPASNSTPLERIKLNYDESSYQQLAIEIENVTEMRLRKLEPRVHAEWHVDHGADLLQRGLTSEAEKNFREAITLDPTSAAAHSGLAQVLERYGNFAGARSEAKTSLVLAPSVNAFLVLARLDLRDNNSQAASEDVQRALGLEPANEAALALKKQVDDRLTEQR